MRTAIVWANRLLPSSETFIKEQVRALRDWQPVLVGEEVVSDGLSLEGLDVRVLRPKHESLSERAERLGYRWLRWPARHYLKLLASLKARVVHAHFGTHATDVWPLVRALGLPMVVTLHGYDINVTREWWERGGGGVRRLFYPRRLLAMADHPRVQFVAVSQAIHDRAIQFGIPPEKICVRYIGIDTTRFQPGPVPLSQREPRVLFVGRQVEKKGCELLLRAFVRVQQLVPGAQLVIVGDGPLRVLHQALAVKLNLRASFLGALPPAGVRAEMGRARVFCLPSITATNGDAEGLPISILEAQACGLPVVTSARGGATEGILDGRTGFVFPEGDQEALEDRLLRYLRMPESQMEIMSDAARVEMIGRFDLFRCTARLSDLYTRVVNEIDGHVE